VALVGGATVLVMWLLKDESLSRLVTTHQYYISVGTRVVNRRAIIGGMSAEEIPDALAAVRAASVKHLEAVEGEKAHRHRLYVAIAHAIRVGAGPSAVERSCHYDRQHINRIRQDAGLPARRRATVQKIPKAPR
jgi:hypothetical protein